MLPGRALHRLAARICSAETLERVVEPAIADLQKEFSGGVADRSSRRWWVLLIGYAAVLEVIAVSTFDSFTVADEDRDALVRTFFWTVGILICAGGLLIVLGMAQSADVGAGFLKSAAYVAPQALPIAIPIGLTLGIAFGLAGRAVSVGTRKVVLLAAVLASAVTFGTMAWVMPAANQSYRQAMDRTWGDRGVVAKESSEMTLGELRRESKIARGSGQPGMARRLEWKYHLRWALPCATTVLALFAFALTGRDVARRAVVMASCAFYFIVLFAGELVMNKGLPPVLGAWLPNLTFGVAATAMLVSRAQSSKRLTDTEH